MVFNELLEPENKPTSFQNLQSHVRDRFDWHKALAKSTISYKNDGKRKDL